MTVVLCSKSLGSWKGLRSGPSFSLEGVLSLRSDVISPIKILSFLFLRLLFFMRLEAREWWSTKGPSWGYQRLVLGAIGSFLSTFGENRPRFLKNLSKLTFEYPHEEPCVAKRLRADEPHSERQRDIFNNPQVDDPRPDVRQCRRDIGGFLRKR